MSVNRLVTMAPSHYSEKARWALDRLGVPYVEECVAPGLHFRALKRLGAKSVPTLQLADGTVLRDSTDILHHLDKAAAAEARLFPSDEALRAQVQALEDEFDEKLAPLVRDWMYSWAIDDLTALSRVFSNRASFAVRLAMPIFARGVRDTFRRRLRKVPAEERYQTLLTYWSTVDDRLADGRQYLVGDRFTAADLTLAAIAAHVVAEDNFRGGTLPLHLRPPKQRERTELFRETPTGRFVARIYREERDRRVAPR